jgi:hypothetical protein
MVPIYILSVYAIITSDMEESCGSPDALMDPQSWLKAVNSGSEVSSRLGSKAVSDVTGKMGGDEPKPRSEMSHIAPSGCVYNSFRPTGPGFMIPLVNSENELRASLGLAKVCARCSTEAQSAVIAQYKFSEPEVRGWKASQPAALFVFC